MAPGGTTTITVTDGAVPGAVFVAGYILGLLVEGTNNIPANVNADIEATNTVPVQTTNTVATAVTTTIDDPDNTPSTGDETATPAAFNVTYNPLDTDRWRQRDINYRQATGTNPPTAADNTQAISAGRRGNHGEFPLHPRHRHRWRSRLRWS